MKCFKQPLKFNDQDNNENPINFLEITHHHQIRQTSIAYNRSFLQSIYRKYHKHHKHKVLQNYISTNTLS